MCLPVWRPLHYLCDQRPFQHWILYHKFVLLLHKAFQHSHIWYIFTLFLVTIDTIPHVQQSRHKSPPNWCLNILKINNSRSDPGSLNQYWLLSHVPPPDPLCWLGRLQRHPPPICIILLPPRLREHLRRGLERIYVRKMWCAMTSVTDVAIALVNSQ